ncbi:MAG: hypothetical protein LBR70_03475 [Lactobacillaceae bacterium]|nr:hypothetical protein [Lactobacillaceae bacterium]
MFKYILLLALIGVGGYFLMQKIEADKLSGNNSVANMQTDDNSTAAKRAIKTIVNEDYDYEKR